MDHEEARRKKVGGKVQQTHTCPTRLLYSAANNRIVLEACRSQVAGASWGKGHNHCSMRASAAACTGGACCHRVYCLAGTWLLLLRGARMRGSGVKPVCGYVPAGPNGMNRECDPVYNRWSICKGSAQRCKVATNVLDCHQPPGISYPGQQHLHPQGCVPAMPCYIAQSCPWIPVPLLCHEMHTQPPCMRMLILYSAIWKILIMVGAFCIQCWT